MKPTKYNRKQTDINAAVSDLGRGGNDPFNIELKQLKSEEKSTHQEISSTRNQLLYLVIKNPPTAPKSHIGDTAGFCFIWSGIVVVVLFVLHILVWILNLVFDIPWNTWGWTKGAFLYGIIISSAATLVAFIKYQTQLNHYHEKQRLYEEYVATKARLENEIQRLTKEANRLEKEVEELWMVRKNVLGTAIRTRLGIPISEVGLSEYDYNAVKEQYLDLMDEKSALESIPDLQMRDAEYKNFINRKLQFFYEVSMRFEINHPEAFKEFSSQLDDSNREGNANIMRYDIVSDNSTGLTRIERISSYRRMLSTDVISKSLKLFQEQSQIDTSKFGIFTDTDKKAQQSIDMNAIVEKARNKYREFIGISESVAYALAFARGCAYRNIYLGVELLNYIRTNAGGSNLSAAKDSINFNVVHSGGGMYSHQELVSNPISNALEGLDYFFDTLSDDSTGPLGAIAAGAIGLGMTIFGGAFSHFEAVAKNQKFQRDLTNEMTSMVDSYTKGRGQMLRAMEIIESIVKANKGFMAIYEPLRDKVFGNAVNTVNRDELLQLVAAMKDYKKITESKIK